MQGGHLNSDLDPDPQYEQVPYRSKLRYILSYDVFLNKIYNLEYDP